MTDRVPGMPGQYKLTMNGQTLSVTIERDDQPLVRARHTIKRLFCLIA